MILQTTNKNRAHNTTHGSLNKTLPLACVTDKHYNTYIYIIILLFVSCLL